MCSFLQANDVYTAGDSRSLEGHFQSRPAFMDGDKVHWLPIHSLMQIPQCWMSTIDPTTGAKNYVLALEPVRLSEDFCWFLYVYLVVFCKYFKYRLNTDTSICVISN